jgi:hypothetical protein
MGRDDAALAALSVIKGQVGLPQSRRVFLKDVELNSCVKEKTSDGEKTSVSNNLHLLSLFHAAMMLVPSKIREILKS